MTPEEMERRIKALEDKSQPSCIGGCAFFLVVFLVCLWGDLWMRGVTDWKPFLAFDKVPYQEWKDKNK